MRKIKGQRIVIYLFCTLLIGSGFLTIALNLEDIGKTVVKSIQQSWEETGQVSTTLIGGLGALEESIENNIFAKETYIDLYGLTERILGRHYMRDKDPSKVVVKDNTDKLQFITFQANPEEKVEQIAKINTKLEGKGIPMLFVQTPLKNIRDFTVLPDAVEDYANSNTDIFLSGLSENNVDFIDLREKVEEDGLDKEALFFNTDHHWTTETAFWAVQKVVQKLEEDGEILLDEEGFFTDLQNYKLTTYENSFLGSQGRRVGKYYGGVDDYTLITPNFETNYCVTINKSDSSTVYEGTFEESILFKRFLDMSEDVYTNRYAAYFGGDYPEVIIKNKMAQNNHKVLIIKDSFALPFTAFLSTMVEQINMLDLRYYDETKLEAYIDEVEPDLVLYVYKSVTTQ